jgi:hypothetical protein
VSDVRVLLATWGEHPHLYGDEQLVLPELTRLGVPAEPAVWTDESVDWAGALVVVRNTWDYTSRYGEFVRWVDRVDRTATLWNPADVLRRNIDKRYLESLAAAGLPVVPTAWIGRGKAADLDDVLATRGWARAVVKPAVSAGARDTLLVTYENAELARDLVARVSADRDVMVQPYLESVEGYGERSLVYFAGAFSHAVRKPPMLAGAAPLDEPEPVEVAADERSLAERAIAWVGRELLYARVDIARADDGTPMLMELELTEPRLFLQHEGAAARFATAIAAKVAALTP